VRGGVGGLFDCDGLRCIEDTSSAAVGTLLFGDDILTDRDEVDFPRSDGEPIGVCECVGVGVEEVDVSFPESSGLIGLP
jgi:hypothetical protein